MVSNRQLSAKIVIKNDKMQTKLQKDRIEARIDLEP